MAADKETVRLPYFPISWNNIVCEPHVNGGIIRAYDVAGQMYSYVKSLEEGEDPSLTVARLEGGRKYGLAQAVDSHRCADGQEIVPEPRWGLWVKGFEAQWLVLPDGRTVASIARSSFPFSREGKLAAYLNRLRRGDIA